MSDRNTPSHEQPAGARKAVPPRDNDSRLLLCRMQFSLKTLLSLPVFVGLLLGHYLFLERGRVLVWQTAGQFWGWFVLDCLLMVTATACVVGCYASLRTEDRSTFTHGPRRLLLRTAVFLVPFVAGLNPVIGYGGRPDSRYAVRVCDDYLGMLTYGWDACYLVTFGWHVPLTVFLGFAALWICGRLDHTGST